MLPPPVTMLFAVMSQVPEDCKVTVPEKKDTDPVASTALEVGSPRAGAPLPLRAVTLPGCQNSMVPQLETALSAPMAGASYHHCASRLP